MFYLELFRALDREKVRYLVVGGIAVNLHGIGRLTVDVDLMLALDSENLGRFVAVAKSLGLKPSIPVSVEDIADASKVEKWITEKHMLAFALHSPDPATPTLDVLVNPVVPFEDAYARRVTTSVEALEVPVACIDDIIRLKTGTGRKKDEADILALNQVKAIRDRNK